MLNAKWRNSKLIAHFLTLKLFYSIGSWIQETRTSHDSTRKDIERIKAFWMDNNFQPILWRSAKKRFWKCSQRKQMKNIIPKVLLLRIGWVYFWDWIPIYKKYSIIKKRPGEIHWIWNAIFKFLIFRIFFVSVIRWNVFWIGTWDPKHTLQFRRIVRERKKER